MAPMNAKALVVFIPLVVVSLLATSMAALEARRTPDWQAVLDTYLLDNRLQPSSVQQMTRARYPAAFTPELGAPVTAGWRWQIERLPHPPLDLYCALVQLPAAPGADDPLRQVVYVGYLTDALYRTGWIVYVGRRTPFPPQLPEQLALIGCDLDITTP